ncbi:MAG: preprotein translocase subunit SecY [Candidatus Eisenbacteria bacterium]|uniref:Protein translocase subunit SecY n=1 Tax=Eiseniibacteriota bacterium TaxID=2212470 RepID=A0A956LXM7_UNCEI|nr:preprotein translocase subunit SecY [Candidatus Eisenbacteria bacterium]
MFGAIQTAFQIPELKRRLLWTMGLLVVYRLGSHVPTAGVNGDALTAFFNQQGGGGLFGLYDLFAGGNFRKATIFALGIMPYISASIILQLFGAVIPYFERLRKEEEGRKRITQYTRYGTVALAAVQALGIAFFLENLNAQTGRLVVPHPGLGFRLLTVLTLTAGTIFVMWLGEMITERGVGNGISLIIMIGIVARFPIEVLNTIRAVQQRTLSPVLMAAILIGMVAITAFVVWVNNAQRRVPVQYARRVVGRKMYGGQTTHLPLRVITAGVIPIIFAQSIIIFPSTLGSFFPDVDAVQNVIRYFQPGAALYIILYSILIIFFTYFYTAIVFNPVDIAENMKKYGGFIPGIQPGKHTADYLDKILLRITLPGAIFLALIAVLPDLLIYKAHVPFYFGGTSLLIIVSVGLDTLKQIESHLLMRHYDGFMKKGRMRAQGLRSR